MTYAEYRKKLNGCFTGKAVGGTLGMPLEGNLSVRSISYYDPVPTEMLPNDDLDLQVVWAEELCQRGFPVNRRDLADAWLLHPRILWDEYGVVMRNLKAGLYPPLSGSYDNKFIAGMGSAIRTEIWAAMAPGDPALAVRFAREDACCDHADYGVDATLFIAALESAAFTENNMVTLIETALSFVPEEGRIGRMVRDTMAWYRETGDAAAVRDRILTKYFDQNWTDVAINLSYILLGWIDGEQETDICKKINRALCTAVSLGHDADCTGATLGSLLGILYPDGFEKRWTDPIGDALVISACIANMHENADLPAFCDKIAELCLNAQLFYGSSVYLDGAPAFNLLPRWAETPEYRLAPQSPNESLVVLRPYTIRLFYPEKTALAPGETGQFSAIITNPKGNVLADLKLSVPEGWQVVPDTFALCGKECRIEFQVTAPVRSRRVMYNPLTFTFDTGDITFSAAAGLAETIPLLQDGCEKLNIYAHYLPVPDGAHTYTVRIRHPYRLPQARLLAAGNRPVKVMLDGKVVLEQDGTEYTPAFHRTRNVAFVELTGNWQTLEICCGEARKSPVDESRKDGQYRLRALYDTARLTGEQNEPGELFFGFGHGTSYEWLGELEYTTELL